MEQHQQNMMQQMQQQPVMQQEQMSNPQMGQQQMMLCPMRLVYENPIMIPHGDQMQQNQTIFINPQNPPPWMRPVQNQVIYVQQMPNNLVPIQQNIDPNLYVQQNFVGYPQQQIITNPQEQIRYNMQIPNIIQPNMIQNIPMNNRVNQVVQPNGSQAQVGQPLQAVVDDKGNVIANYQPMQPNQVIQNIPQNHYIVNNRQIVNNVQNVQPNVNQMVQQIPNQVATSMVGPQKVQEVPKQTIYKNIAPQMTQQPMTRPQMPQMINQQEIQNIQMPNQQIGQIFVPNIRTSVPIQVQNVAPNMMSNVQPFVNMPIQQPVERQMAPSNVDNKNGATVSYTAVRNGQSYTYRAIQPRPQQFRNVPNLLPMVQNQPPIQRPMIPMNQVNPTRNMAPTIPNTNMPQIKTEFNNTNITFNRKRKSESPDEIQKKIPANKIYGTITVTPKPPVSLPKNQSIDTATNTNSTYKLEERNINQPHVLQIKPMDVQMTTNSQDFNKIIVSQQMDTANISNTMTENKSVAHLMEKEKLIRNTVFTQARGRLLTDKNVPNNVNAETNVKPGDITAAIKNANTPIKTETVQTAVQVKIEKPDTPKREMKFYEPAHVQASTSNAVRNLNVSNSQMIGPVYTMTNQGVVNINSPKIPMNTMYTHATNNQIITMPITTTNNQLSANYVNAGSNQISSVPSKTINNQISAPIIPVYSQVAPNPPQRNTSTPNTATIPTNIANQRITNTPLPTNSAMKPSNETKMNTDNVLNTVFGKQTPSTSANNEQSKANIYDFNPKEEPNINYKQNRAKIVEELAKKLNKQAAKANETAKINEPSPVSIKTEEKEEKPNVVEPKTEPLKIEIKPEAPAKEIEETTVKQPKATIELKIEPTETKDVIMDETEALKTEIKPQQEKDKRNSLAQQMNDLNKTNDCRLSEVKNEDCRKDYKNINDMTGKEIHMVDGNVVKQDKDYVLTHVLDGYVIQESNVPFAIRKPLKEKMLYTNVSVSSNDTETKVEPKDVTKDTNTKPNVTKAPTKETPRSSASKDTKQAPKDNATKDKSNVNLKEEKEVTKENKIMDISSLNINEEVKNQETDDKTENDNPFASVKPPAVKSWTVDELSAHLSKYNWSETISKLQEHEIDGESLFLASRPQLISIGVSETHVDFICDFVKS